MSDITAQPNIPTRLNNPGDLKEAGQANSTPDSSGFATFPTPQDGYTALLNDVQSKINKNPNDTLEQFAGIYAPPSDGNNTGKYTADLANQLGVAPNAPISSLEPKIGQFADAIAKNEGYNPNDTQTTSQTSPSSTSPSLKNYLLAGGAGLLAGGISAIKNNGGNILGNVAKDAITDAAVGTAVEPVGGTLAGAGVGVVQGLVDSLFGGNKSSSTSNPTSSDTSNTTQGVLPTDTTNTQTESDQESQEDIQRIEDAQKATAALSAELQVQPTGKLLASSPQVQEGLGTMGQNGYLPDTSTGLKDFGVKTNSGAFGKSWDDINDLSSGAEQILNMEGGKGDVESTRQKTYKNIEATLPQPQWDEAKRNADEIINSGNKDFGNGDGSMSLGKMERLKKDYGQLAGKWDATLPTAKRGAYKALNRAFRDEIASKTKHKDLYNKVMKEEEKIFTAQKLMKKMDGKKALEHKGILRGVLKSYGKYIGTYLGDKIGGPLGAIVGTMVGDYVEKRVDKKFGKTFFESKEGKKLMDMVGKKSPRAKKMLEAEIIKYEQQGEEQVKEHLRKEDIIKKRHQEWQKEKGIPKKELGKKLEGLFGGNAKVKETPKKEKGFIPSNEWQEVPKDTVLPNGLTMKMDMKTGKSYARKS